MLPEDYQQSHTDINDLYSKPDEFIGKIVTVKGWVKFFRKGKSIAFVRLSDGTCITTLQIICDDKFLPDQNKEYFDDLFKRGKRDISITVTGLIVKSPGKEQPIEMQSHTYEIHGDVVDPETYPVSKSEHGMEYLRTIPHLRNRTDTHSSVVRVKSTVRFAMAEYFNMHRFVEVQVPCITDNECESGANPFVVTTIVGDDYSKDFFKKKTFLTVSGQLHLETIILGGLSKAWTMTTAFRAEPSMSPLHMAEFWMAELEFCCDTLLDNIKVNEGCIKHCIRKVLSECYPELEFFQKKFKPGLIETLKKYATKPFVITTHTECVKQMLSDIESGKVKIDPEKKATDDLCIFKEIPAYDDDLSKDHEKYITGIMHDKIPVFVCHYPAKIKAFYMPKLNKGSEIEIVDNGKALINHSVVDNGKALINHSVVDNGKALINHSVVDNFDMLMPEIGEVVGGSMRETDYDELKSRMIEMGINPESLQFYLDLRKYGTISHGGSGIGFDRLMLAITGMHNIRDMIPFPRSYETCHY